MKTLPCEEPYDYAQDLHPWPPQKVKYESGYTMKVVELE